MGLFGYQENINNNTQKGKHGNGPPVGVVYYFIDNLQQCLIARTANRRRRVSCKKVKSQKYLNLMSIFQSGREKKMVKRLGSKRLGCRDGTSRGVQTGSLRVVTFGHRFSVGEKFTVILYFKISRHAGTPTRN